MSKTVRFPSLDYIRVIACFLVILLHLAALQFQQFSSAWPGALIFESAARMSVPLFFMLSGYLLLDHMPTSLARFYYRRYARILLPFFAVCILYYFTPMYAGYSPWRYLGHIAVHYVDYHLWYVYALLGIYLCLPFFCKIVNGKDGAKLALLYVIFWATAFMLVPALTDGNPFAPEVRQFQLHNQNLASAYIISDIFSSFFMNWNLLFFYGFMGYLLVAWLIRQRLPRPGSRVCIFCLFLTLFSTLAIILLTWRSSLQKGAPEQTWFHNLSPFVASQAISFFIFCCGLKHESRLVASLSDKSYWIYLLHLILLRFFTALWPLAPSYCNFLLIPAHALAIFITAYLAAIPLRAVELRILRLLGIS